MPDDAAFTEIGRKLFAGPCDFIWAAVSAASLPPPDVPEIAFAGRSNVGKSSLVNALTGRTTLARTSRTPGRTQQLNFFDLGPQGQPRLRLVDMPGYGHAAVSREKISTWTTTMRDYLRGRPNLVRVFVLVDSRHGLKASDSEIMDALDKAAMSYQIVMTKADEVSATDLAVCEAGIAQALSKRPAAYPRIAVTSARQGAGITELRAGIAQLLSERAGFATAIGVGAQIG